LHSFLIFPLRRRNILQDQSFFDETLFPVVKAFFLLSSLHSYTEGITDGNEDGNEDAIADGTNEGDFEKQELQVS